MIKKRAEALGYTHLKLVPRLPELRAIEGWYGDIKISCQYNDFLRLFSKTGYISPMTSARICGDNRVAVVMQLDRAGHIVRHCAIVLIAAKIVQLTISSQGFGSANWLKELLVRLGFTVFPSAESEPMLRRFGIIILCIVSMPFRIRR